MTVWELSRIFSAMRSRLTVDLRSDTVTKPTKGMRLAMAEAEVGDDVYGEDPTVQALERRACELTGKEAALFVVSGTMANQLAIRLLTSPGDEVLMHKWSHPFLYEGGAASLWGVTIRPLEGDRGLVEPKVLREALRPDEYYMPRQRLLCLENTHNRGGGSVMSLGLMAELSAIAHEAGLAVHLDGARIFNASIASGVPVREYAALADTVCFCLSKGLGAPVGSLLCGRREDIVRARRFRHQMGGSWRQAGILAAAGLYALEHHVQRLTEDHRRAKVLAEAISQSRAARLVFPVETNIVLFEARENSRLSAQEIVAALREKGVLVGLMDQKTLRAVTHLDIDDEGLEIAVRAIMEL